jgi:hypothetical protein
MRLYWLFEVDEPIEVDKLVGEAGFSNTLEAEAVFVPNGSRWITTLVVQL